MAKGRKTGGRVKGVSGNLIPALVKDMIAQALKEEGGVDYLRTLAKNNPVAFAGLLGRLIPVQVGGDPNGAPIRLEEIKRVIVDRPHD